MANNSSTAILQHIPAQFRWSFIRFILGCCCCWHGSCVEHPITCTKQSFTVNHTNIQGSLIEHHMQRETGTKNELLPSKSNTQTDQLKLTKSYTERPNEKSMALPTKKKHAPNDVKSNGDSCMTTLVPKPRSYNNMAYTFHKHLSNGG